MKQSPAPLPPAGDFILTLRGQKVILDSDLAALYQTTTKRLNEQVKRNLDRFPSDFMFQLTKQENQQMRIEYPIKNLEEKLENEDVAGIRPQIATFKNTPRTKRLPKSLQIIWQQLQPLLDPPSPPQPPKRRIGFHP